MKIKHLVFLALLLCLFLILPVKAETSYPQPTPTQGEPVGKWWPDIVSICYDKWQINPYLAAAIVKQESWFNETAENIAERQAYEAGSKPWYENYWGKGLTQVTGPWIAGVPSPREADWSYNMPPEADRNSAPVMRNPFDGKQNLDRGCWYLSVLKKHYGNDINKTITAYNKGFFGVDSGSVDVNNNNYVTPVTKYMNEYLSSVGLTYTEPTQGAYGEYDIYLIHGWNLVSSPVQEGYSADTALSFVKCYQNSSMGPIYATNKDFKGPWAYDTTTKQYVKSSRIEPYVGYWIYSELACDVKVTGTAITSMPPLKLKTGWNLISGQGDIKNIGADCKIQSGPWWWSGPITNNYLKEQTLSPWWGYWIKVADNCTITDNREILTNIGEVEQQPITISGWHTSGNKILDPNGNEVKWKSVSWQGFEESSAFIVQGVWTAGITEQLDKIKAAGFNSIRIPYSNLMLVPGQTPTVGYIEPNKNPSDLKTRTSLEALDYVIDEAAKRNLYIILDRHKPSYSQSELWYTSDVSERKWIEDWVFLADRYENKPNVIAFDLHNEPHGTATWGDGNRATDWKAAAERAGNEILATNPNLLIVVEGIQNEKGESYRWGGSLMQIREKPVSLSIPNKVVYSPHDYGPGVVRNDNDVMFAAANYPNNLPGYWDSKWGYISKEGIAPIWLGEFGVNNTIDGTKEWIWFNTLVKYIDDNNMNFAYWTWAPDYMSPDSGGIFADDWVTLNQKKMNVLNQILQ